MDSTVINVSTSAVLPLFFSAVVFFSYIGFDSIPTAAQEAKTPQRSLPIATITSLIVATVLYISVGMVLTGLVPYQMLNTPDPIAVAVDAAGDDLRWLRPVVKLGAVLGLSSVVLVLLMGQARIFYAMAEDVSAPQRGFQCAYTRNIYTGTCM